MITKMRLIHRAFEPTPIIVGEVHGIMFSKAEEALEWLWVRTQNLDVSWLSYLISCGFFVPTHEVKNKGACRSTSVGDEVILIWGDGLEEKYVCAVMGWEKIETAPML